MSERPGDLDDEAERLLSSLVSGNLLVVRQPAEMAAEADLPAERAEERIADLVEEGLLVEVSAGRYTITDEGFEAVVEEMALDDLG